MPPSKTHRLLLWLAAAFTALLVILFVASFFLDPIIRARVERGMNAKLKGYQTTVGRAHLRLFDGALTLRDITLIQNAHPQPPVGNIPILTIEIQWHELLTWHVVADLLIVNPQLHIDLTQLRSERVDKVPLSQKGWQDAVQSIYPFKINRFIVREGSVIYIDTDPKRPLKLDRLYITAENIRNTSSSTGTTNPSPIRAEANVFEVGKASIKGDANFLAKPFVSLAATYHLKNIPLNQFGSELRRVNFDVKGGTLASDGFAEYGPKGTKIEVYKVTIVGGRFEYAHTAATSGGEARRIKEVKTRAQEVNNAPETLVAIDRLNIEGSEAGYTNKVNDPHYRLFISNLWLELTNLSNRFSKGPAHLGLRGRFMDSGVTSISGDFRPEKSGPDFDMNLAVLDTDLPSLNDVLRAYGRFDVKTGQLSVYSHIAVRRGEMTGYVKPLFSNVEVYNAQKDKNKPILHQLYELAIGTGAKLAKNSSTQKVATEVKVSGKLNNPDVSVWQALVQFVQNGFIEAILPGFARQIKRPAPG
jgi:hypothetical protein